MASSRMMLMMTAAVVGCVSVFAPNPVLAQAGGTTMTITVTGWGEGAAAATADKNAYVAYQEAGIYIYQTLGLCTVTKTVVTDGPAQMFGRGDWFHDFEATYDISWTAPWGPGGGGAGGGDPGDGSEDPGDGSEGPDDGGPEPGDGSEDQGSSDDEEYDEEYYEQGYYE